MPRDRRRKAPRSGGKIVVAIVEQGGVATSVSRLPTSKAASGDCRSFDLQRVIPKKTQEELAIEMDSPHLRNAFRYALGGNVSLPKGLLLSRFAKRK
ncbi:MAG: hypothetical protein ABR501_13545 [Pyrinomonadaceae bacterium]